MNDSGGDRAAEDEFDAYAIWTADAVEALGAAHAVPAACRGSGSPTALEWLGAELGLSPTTRLLDVGAGAGGPAELARRTFGSPVALCDPMPGACRAARRLFGRPTVVASGTCLPFARGAFQAVWALGVLCLVDDKVALLRELARVVGSSGGVGLIVFVRRVEDLADAPEENTFPTEDELARAILDAGLEESSRTRLTDHPAQPEEWTRLIAEVDEHIRARHGDTRLWHTVQEQQRLLDALINGGSVEGMLVVCRHLRR